MSWLLFALSGPVLWAASVHFDKYLVERFFKDAPVAVLLVFTALIGLLMLPFIAFFQPEALRLDHTAIALMTLTGILYMGAMLFYLQALLTEEASAISPLFQASSLFAFALGYLVLGETLSRTQLIGGALIIGGALLVSLRFGGHRGRIKRRTVALMLICTLALAFSSLIFKVFAMRDEFWTTTFWMFVGEAIFGAGLLAVPTYRRAFMRILGRDTAALLAINGANELINLGGGLGNRYALTLAPLSLVQAVGGTTTIFVFVFGVALTLFFPKLGREDLSARNLLQKGFSALLVAAGIALVNT